MSYSSLPGIQGKTFSLETNQLKEGPSKSINKQTKSLFRTNDVLVHTFILNIERK